MPQQSQESDHDPLARAALIEDAVRRTADAAFAEHLRALDDQPMAPDLLEEIEGLINQQYSPLSVFILSARARFRWFERMAGRERVRIEGDLRHSHGLPFAEERAAEIRRALEPLLLAEWHEIVNLAFGDAERHLERTVGYVADYKFDELRKQREELWVRPPEFLMADCSETVRAAIADVVLTQAARP
jgi:hypothetical protein